ncbi:MAG: response regulator transcription factor [bacterium]|nr:MAG: response regulator transcription factor [bacterium]
MAGTTSRKVLLVEDDRDISHLVKLHLQDAGYHVSLAEDGNTGLNLAQSGNFGLIILDLMLPDMDGLDLCRALRAASNFTPILMLTAKSSEVDRVLGLEMGADDYLIKPFSVRELVARVKAIFRRAGMEGAMGDRGDLVSRGDLVIDTARRKVTLKGRSVSLTAKEFDLLLHFAAHPGRVYTRAQLLDQVWGYGYEGYEHTVNSHINRLRGKIEADPAKPGFILTVWGVGYKFADREDLEQDAG